MKERESDQEIQTFDRREKEVDRVEVPFRLKFSRTEALDTLPIGVSEAERPLAQTSEGALESCQDMLFDIGQLFARRIAVLVISWEALKRFARRPLLPS